MYGSVEQAAALLATQGYTVSDPWDVVAVFEEKIARYGGATHGVAVDSCTNALFLCLKYLGASGAIDVPRRTYLSVPGAVLHAGCTIRWVDTDWSGAYPLKPYPVFDSAARFTRGMYVQDSYYCLSFHIRKTLPICKGGMILTNDRDAASWFRLASYEGRDRGPYDRIDDVEVLGWNMYMPPEQAARGLLLFEQSQEHNPDSAGAWSYRDLSTFKVFRS